MAIGLLSENLSNNLLQNFLNFNSCNSIFSALPLSLQLFSLCSFPFFHWYKHIYIPLGIALNSFLFPHFELIHSQDFNYHFHADDSQIYIYSSNYLKLTFPAGRPSCHIKFKLNMFKTIIIIFPYNLLHLHSVYKWYCYCPNYPDFESQNQFWPLLSPIILY